MKNIILKIIVIAIVITGILTIPQNKVEAKGNYTVSGIAGMMSPDYVNPDKYSPLQRVIGKILGFLQVASALTTVVVVAFLGFKMLTETPEVKREVKHKGLPIIIGVVLVLEQHRLRVLYLQLQLGKRLQNYYRNVTIILKNTIYDKKYHKLYFFCRFYVIINM